MRAQVRVTDLPENAEGRLLYCWKCGGEYSATRGDYFWVTGSRPFACSAGHVHTNLQLVRKVVTMEEAS